MSSGTVSVAKVVCCCLCMLCWSATESNLSDCFAVCENSGGRLYLLWVIAFPDWCPSFEGLLQYVGVWVCVNAFTCLLVCLHACLGDCMKNCIYFDPNCIHNNKCTYSYYTCMCMCAKGCLRGWRERREREFACGSLCATQIVRAEERRGVSIITPWWPIHMQSEQGI